METRSTPPVRRRTRPRDIATLAMVAVLVAFVVVALILGARPTGPSKPAPSNPCTSQLTPGTDLNRDYAGEQFRDCVKQQIRQQNRR